MSTNVVISPRPNKTSDMIDQSGNIIDRQTKQIIKPMEQEYIPPVQAQQQSEPNKQEKIEIIGVPINSIQIQIKEAKERLKQLKTLNKLKMKEARELNKIKKS